MTAVCILVGVVFFVGAALFAYGRHEYGKRPPALRLHLLNEETIGIILMVIAIWTFAVYGLMQIVN